VPDLGVRWDDDNGDYSPKESMIRSVKDLTHDQKVVIEGLLGHSVSDAEQISVRAIPTAPEWLRNIQLEAKQQGVHRLTSADIDAEIAATRRERRERGEQPRR
jgi:hypothetical protein